MKRLSCLFIVTLMSATVFAGSTSLFLKAGRIDTSVKGTAQVKARAESNPYYVGQFPAGEMRLYIVQFNRVIDSTIKDMLSRHNMKVADYIPDNAFVVWTTGLEMNALRDSSIQWKGIYQPAFRIDRKLTKCKAATVRVQVSLYSFVDPRSCRFTLADMGATIEKAGISDWQSTFLATVPVAMLPQLARVRGLKWVEEYVEPELHSIQTDIPVKSGSNGVKNEAAGTIMNTAPMWNAGYTGASQIAAVCDTGLDVGDVDSIHRDFFNDTNSDGHNDKIVAAYALGRTNDWSDDQGHGTHTAGSVLGNGAKSNGRFKGPAYDARLVEQSVLDSRDGLGGLPSDLNDLFQQAYDDGARVHSNSWGASVAGQYDTSAVQVDQFAWNHKDMVITFSAGNSGVDSNRDGVVDMDS
ncbi:MAG: S8 family serine peptidase, partial [Holophagae bacterium]|nr:S8 family serine peptidase [Holophagae bacterium]